MGDPYGDYPTHGNDAYVNLGNGYYQKIQDGNITNETARASAVGECIACSVECFVKWLGVKEIEHVVKHTLERKAEKIAAEAVKAGAKFAIKTVGMAFSIKNHYVLGACTVSCL